MRPKTHVVVLMGGMNTEHDISMKSGAMVLENINEEKYKVTPMEISREGEWVLPLEQGELMDMPEGLRRLNDMHPDCVFIALHGPYGEDGRIQGMLDVLGVPYTGSGCTASATAIDKIRSKALVAHAGIAVADEVVFTRAEWDDGRADIRTRIEDELGFPCIIKNPTQGSSLGLGIPQNPSDLQEVVSEILGFGFTVMAERYIEGVELTCGILDIDDEQGAIALPVTSIRATGSPFFDYHAKYTPGAAEEITPADIPDSLRDEVQECALRAHKIIGCRGFSRSDMIFGDDELVWLEINTIPGLTETSLFPQAAAAAGISFPELVEMLIENALL